MNKFDKQIERKEHIGKKTTAQANVTACYINNVWRDRIYTQTHARIRIIRFVFSRPYF